jgi:hypothetical protein
MKKRIMAHSRQIVARQIVAIASIVRGVKNSERCFD